MKRQYFQKFKLKNQIKILKLVKIKQLNMKDEKIRVKVKNKIQNKVVSLI